MADNKLFYGDNLEILRDKSKIPDESVDLCYIDPPFNSKRNYSQIYNNLGSEDTAQAQAFEDTWSWGDDARDGFEYILDVLNLQLGKTTPQLVELMRGLHKVLGESDLFAYLSHIALRVIEIRRVLKPTGSFYLHCDPTASHYLKLILDAVFVPGGGNYMNEIAWCYGSGGASKQHFSRKHDTIFWYVKGKIWTFNVDAVREPYSSPEKSMTPKVMNGKSYEKMHPLGRIPFDWWQIPILTNSAKERLGYPTQKPEALLERIVKASSNEGDVVLDAYCGCGTSVAVAQRLGRKWIGIDITYQSISLILLRMKAQFPSTWEAIETDLLLDGVPRDIASARALANRKDDKTRKEFEKWAVLTYSDDKARINSKKGADAGIDGVAFFMGAPGENGKAVIQVKSGKTDRGDIAKLNSDRQREKAEIGYLITLQEPTKPMKDEAAAAGVYKHPQFDRSDSRIQIVTVRELLNGARINLPMLRPDLIRSAESVEVDKTAVTMFEVDS